MKRVVIFAVLAACLLAAQQPKTAPPAEEPKPVPISAEPRHHLIIENEKVKVYDVTVAPHDQTLLHQHDHDYVFVTLGDSDIENRVLGKPPVELKLTDGATRFSKGPFAHVAVNKADTPFHNITIEILPTEATGDQQPALMYDAAGVTADLLFDRPVVRGWSYTFQPGAGLPLHEHKTDHLVVLLTDAKMKNEVVGEPTAVTERKRGEVVWVPAQPSYKHALTNVGTTTVKFIEIELK